MTALPQDHKSSEFTFDYAGKSYTIPAFSSLPTGVLRKARKGVNDADTTFLILETLLTEDSPELTAIDAMNQTEFGEFIKGWTQGAGVGEA